MGEEEADGRTSRPFPPGLAGNALVCIGNRPLPLLHQVASTALPSPSFPSVLCPGSWECACPAAREIWARSGQSRFEDLPDPSALPAISNHGSNASDRRAQYPVPRVLHTARAITRSIPCTGGCRLRSGVHCHPFQDDPGGDDAASDGLRKIPNAVLEIRGGDFFGN